MVTSRDIIQINTSRLTKYGHDDFVEGAGDHGHDLAIVDTLTWTVICMHDNCMFITPNCSCGCFKGASCADVFSDICDPFDKFMFDSNWKKYSSNVWHLPEENFKAVTSLSSGPVVNSDPNAWRPLHEARAQMLRDGWTTVFIPGRK